MASKFCRACGDEKELDDFYRDSRIADGRESVCRTCNRARAKKWYAANQEQARLTDREWRLRNPGKCVELSKGHAERNPEKHKARQIVSTAVYEGRLSKPSSCEDCGDQMEAGNLHAHHEDYSLPYDIKWLCRDCHNKQHGSLELTPTKLRA